MADKRIVTVDYLNSEGLNKGYINNTFANALKGSKSGSAFLIDDVSPVPYEMGVKVRGKNLLPYPYTNTTKTENGITFTDNGDGSITISGTAEKEAYFYLCTMDFGSNNMWNETANSNGYYVSGCKHFFYNGINKASVIIVPSGTDYSTNPITVKPQIELGTTATAYTPYVPDLTAVKVSRCGKNLLPYPYFDSSKSSVGATITVNEDRSISFSGTPTSYIGFILYKGNALVKSGTFTISVGNLTNISTTLFIYDGSGATLKTYSFTKSVTVNADDYPMAATWNITMARATSNQQIGGTSYPQIELGTTATDYERYIAPTEYTPTADGTVNGVTSLYPNTTLMTDTDGVIIDCEYNRDINKAFAELQQAIISLGGNV